MKEKKDPMGTMSFRTGKDSQQLLAYSFPFEDGIEGTLWMPRRGLTQDEARRLHIYIDAMVTEAAGTPTNPISRTP